MYDAFKPLFNDTGAGIFNDYDLQLVIYPGAETLSAEIQYSSGVGNALANKIANNFTFVLSQLSSLSSSDPAATVSSIQQLPVQEREQLLAFGRGPQVEVPFKNAHHAFERCALEDPETVAVEQGDQSISYGDLNRRADDLAGVLISRGVRVGDFVGLVTVRSIEMVIGIMAVLKAGGAYVPIDSEIPLERIEYILDTADCKVILVHPSVSTDVAQSLDPRKTISLTAERLEHAPLRPMEVPQESPAYVVFTSGSTGKPKVSFF